MSTNSIRRKHSRARRAAAALILLILIAVGAVVFHAALSSAATAVATVLGGGSAVPDERDGILDEPTSVFDEERAGVTGLDPELLRALRVAGTDARADGVEILVNSGWRSARYQRVLFDDAVSEYGSRDEAARWVATAEASVHVSGDAVDVGPLDAALWLGAHGAAYGLCQIYANEPWHFELRPDASASGCPEMYPDATQDPRLHQ